MEPEDSQQWPKDLSLFPYTEPDRTSYSHLKSILILLSNLIQCLISDLFTSSIPTATAVKFCLVQYVPHDQSI